MSATEAATEDEICASCGIAGGGDDVKLKNCTACYLVKYCGVNCQRKHRPQHKRACKRRAAELKDEILFKQPESRYLGDCPICFLPLPLDKQGDTDTMKYTMQTCCSKVVCDGCIHANNLREKEARLTPKCPFCRKLAPSTEEEIDQNLKKRVEVNDPDALDTAAMNHFQSGDYATAIEYWGKAAELGNIESNYHLSTVYHEGFGVDRDMKKYIYHSEQAAIGGHDTARYNLGVWELWECQKGNIDRAVKHFIISSNLGCNKSIKALKKCYAQGKVSKEDFAAALRAHQAAVDATKSPQRDEAEAFRVMYPDN
eukprot:scaffold1561_cov129-Skeletonema_menzelii.AAC.2